ncbi:hypothetical protein Q3G72_026880 [Acer saccharum]|nr:hypothetical protein Q3G72_026880 [Acer saccharum]
MCRAKAIVEASRRDDAEHEASGIDPSQVEKANEETDEVVPAGPRESETYRSLVSEAHETDYEIITPSSDYVEGDSGPLQSFLIILTRCLFRCAEWGSRPS